MKPAPTIAGAVETATYMGIYRWVGAGLLDCRLLTIIVCETRPYDRSALETATYMGIYRWVGAGLLDC